MEKDNRKYRICFIDYMWYVAEIWHERERTNLNGRMLLFWCWLFVLLIPLGVPPILRLFGWMIGLAIVIPLCFLPDLFCKLRPDRGKCSADVPPRIYTLGMMKRQENKQRFYLWDYLWWMGEKLEQARRTGRVDGEMMLSIYIFALLIFPMMTVTIRLFPGVSALLPCVVFSIVTFAVMSLVSRIYKWRGKAVMSHYAKCRFNELLAVLLFFLAIAIICFMMYLLDKK